MAKITVLVGSVREGRAGIHVANWVRTTLEEQGHTVYLVDPKETTELQALNQMYKSQDSPSTKLTETRNHIVEADGHIAITPEYNHSHSGAIKNILDHFLEEWYFKPFGIITYSAGSFGGIRAAETLRPVISELGAITTPISLAISKVQQTVTEQGLQDEAYKKRLAKMLEEFEWYVKALKTAREASTPY